MSTISSLSAVTDNLVMESGRIFPNIQYNTSFCRCGQILCQPCWPGRTVSGVRVLWVYQWKFTVNFCNRCTVGLIGWHYLKYWVFNNDCTPSTVETSKMLAKLILYYNNLNKVALRCKVSDLYVLFNLKKSLLVQPWRVLHSGWWMTSKGGRSQGHVTYFFKFWDPSITFEQKKVQLHLIGAIRCTWHGKILTYFKYDDITCYWILKLTLTLFWLNDWLYLHKYRQYTKHNFFIPDPNRYRRRCPDPNARIQE